MDFEKVIQIYNDENKFEYIIGCYTGSTTIIINNEGTAIDVPVNISSRYLNLKNIWTRMKNPVAILFSENPDEWYSLVPSTSLVEWKLNTIYGNSNNNTEHIRKMCEFVVRKEFTNPDAVVM
jgi:hypothetical protein